MLRISYDSSYSEFAVAVDPKDGGGYHVLFRDVLSKVELPIVKCLF